MPVKCEVFHAIIEPFAIIRVLHSLYGFQEKGRFSDSIKLPVRLEEG